MRNANHRFKDPAGIAGTGRLARALGKLMSQRGVAVAAIGGRRAEAAGEAALFSAVERSVPLRELPHYSRHILIAVTDEAIPEVAAELVAGGLTSGVVLHTSGSAGPEMLEGLREAGNAVGVLHPLQTVPCAERGVESLPGATWAFAGDTRANAWASFLIERLGGNALAVDPRFWHSYHAGAVMACNYQATLVDCALELMQHAGIGREDALAALGPILRASLENILKTGPEQALTGPIRRGDETTIQRHLAAVASALPETRQLYVAAGLRTIALAERAGLDEVRASRLAMTLSKRQ